MISSIDTALDYCARKKLPRVERNHQSSCNADHRNINRSTAFGASLRDADRRRARLRTYRCQHLSRGTWLWPECELLAELSRYGFRHLLWDRGGTHSLAGRFALMPQKALPADINSPGRAFHSASIVHTAARLANGGRKATASTKCQKV
jgi:hypothetical protein